MIDEKFLEGIGITEPETVKAITEAYSADIKAEQDKTAAVQTSFDEASGKLRSFENMDVEKIKQEAADWKQRCEQLEADRKAKEHSDKIDKFVQSQRMRNSIYADHLKRQIMEQNLQFDDKGILIGGDTVVNSLRESCPDAFAADPNERTAVPISGRVPQAMDGIERAFYAKNPDLYKNN